MEAFYGYRWSSQFDKPHLQSFAKTVWKGGLTGLTYHEIRDTLVYYKWIASHHPHAKPPHQMEFYRAAKSSCKAYTAPLKTERGNPDIAKAHLAQIRKSLSCSM